MKTMTFTITNKLTNFAALKDYKLEFTRCRHTKGNTTKEKQDYKKTQI